MHGTTNLKFIVSCNGGPRYIDISVSNPTLPYWRYKQKFPPKHRTYAPNYTAGVTHQTTVRPGTHYPHVTWAHVMLRVQLGCERQFNIELYGADSNFCHSAYVTWSRVEPWSAHVPSRLSNLCCRTHFVRRDVRVERSSNVTSCFQKWRKCLLKKCANGPFLCDTKSPDYRYQHMRANAWEDIGKELKIKRKFYVSSRDVRIVCPRL
jgi:hypothetical protein